VPLLAPAAHIVLQVQAPLRRLLSDLADGVSVTTDGDTPPDHDLHCDLLSLPHIFRTTLETIPG
jgi:hypothetical protein